MLRYSYAKAEGRTKVLVAFGREKSQALTPTETQAWAAYMERLDQLNSQLE